MKKLLNNKYTIPGLILLFIIYIFIPAGNKYLVCQTTLDHEHIFKNKKIENFIPKEFFLLINPKQSGFNTGAYIYPRSILIRDKRGHNVVPSGLESKKYSAHSYHDESYLYNFKDLDGNESGIWHLNRSTLTYRVIDKEKTTGVIFPAVAIRMTLDETNGTESSFKNKI